MAVVLLMAHSLLSVLLLGALTHQFIGAWWRPKSRATSFMQRVRGVATPSYTNAIVALYVATWIFGIIIYPIYALGPREEFKMEVPPAFGVFEVKEHFGAIGLAVLPAYWYSWRLVEKQGQTHRILLAVLMVIVWFDFLAGHVLNNLGGL